MIRLRRRNPKLILIGVVGSYGKTGTKLAIAHVIGQTKKVQYQSGNYNDLVSVPLIFFGENMPNIFNPIAWLMIFIKNEFKIHKTYPYEAVVLELGTDAPGQIAEFSNYLMLDIAVVTSIAREHMANFSDVTAVAVEELSVETFSRRVIINRDLCDAGYINKHVTASYGFKKNATYHLETKNQTATAYNFGIYHQNNLWLTANSSNPSKAQVYSAAAAAVVSDLLSIDKTEIIKGIESISPASGRMRILTGIRHSTIWDETYNSSPEAVKGALDTLYSLPNEHKIAVLGNMNELGKYSEQAHIEIGNYCDPNQLDLVITIGNDANAHLAPTAMQRGCRVITCAGPYDAGEVLLKELQEGGLVLAKGSQNGVFAEEAIKYILNNPRDSKLLVRQSPSWLKQKRRLIGDGPHLFS